MKNEKLEQVLFAISKKFEGVSEALGLPEDDHEAELVAKACEELKEEVRQILS